MTKHYDYRPPYYLGPKIYFWALGSGVSVRLSRLSGSNQLPWLRTGSWFGFVRRGVRLSLFACKTVSNTTLS